MSGFRQSVLSMTGPSNSSYSRHYVVFSIWKQKSTECKLCWRRERHELHCKHNSWVSSRNYYYWCVKCTGAYYCYLATRHFTEQYLEVKQKVSRYQRCSVKCIVIHFTDQKLVASSQQLQYTNQRLSSQIMLVAELSCVEEGCMLQLQNGKGKLTQLLVLRNWLIVIV